MIKKIVFVLVGMAFFSAQAMDKAESFKRVQSRLLKTTNSDISVIVELEDTFSTNRPESEALRRSANIKANLMSKLSKTGAHEHKRYKNLSIMTVQVDAKGLEALEKSSDVKKIYLNQLRKHSLNSTTRQVQANLAWTKNRTGNGVTLAVIDTALSLDNKMFTRFNFETGLYESNGTIVNQACFTTNTTISGIRIYANCYPNNSEFRVGPGSVLPTCNPCVKGNDHSTLVTSVLAGETDETFSPPRRGVAFDSDVIAVNVFSRVQDSRVCSPFNSCVVALDSDILAGLDYVYSLRNQYNIAAVNLSLGGGAFQNACDGQSVYTNIISQFKNSGTAVVVASGNEGSGTSISEPACVSKAIAVGSVSDDNEVSDFTNSNKLIDFWAPGENISTLGFNEEVNGTSFSAPHVSGAFAILRSFNNKLTVDEITAILKTSGLQIVDPLNRISRPLIQINNALDIAPRPSGIIPILHLLLLNDE